MIKTLVFAAFLLTQGTSPRDVGVVTGRLLAPDGGPAAGVRASAMAVPDSGQPLNDVSVLSGIGETDSSGRYRIENLRPGRYYILAGLVDSATYYPGVSAATGAAIVNVTAGATVSGIDFRVARGSTGLTVSGRVTRDGSSTLGTPAQVTLAPVTPGGQYMNTTAAWDGSFDFQKVRPGAYSITVNPAPGFRPRNVVVGEKDVTGLELLIPWTVAVRGRIVVDGVGPKPSVSILFSGDSGGNTTHGTDSFQTTLAEGSYGVVVSDIPSGYYVKTITGGAADLLATPLRLSRNQSPSEIVVTLGVSTPRSWVKLSGRIVGAQPSAGGQAVVQLDGNTGSLSARIDANGAFEFPMLFPGNYTVRVLPARTELQPISITVPNRDVTGIELALPRMREITGHVDVQDGGPLPRMSLMMTDAPGLALAGVRTPLATLPQALVWSSPQNFSYPRRLAITPQANGDFKVSLPEGQYRVTVEPQASGARPSPYIVRSFTYGGADLLTDPLTVAGDSGGDLRLTFVPPSPNTPVTVNGRVIGLNAPGASARAATVVLSSPSFIATWTAPVNPDGSFVFSKVYPGSYSVRVSSAIPDGSSIAASFDVASRDVSGIDVSIVHEKEVAGRIVIEGRGAMPRVAFPLNLVSGSMPGARPNTMISISPQPDGTFKARLPEGERRAGPPVSLPPGYALKSLAYGGTDLQRNPLKVGMTDTAELLLTLTAPSVPPVKVSGRIVDLDRFQRPPGAVGVTLTSGAYVTPLTVTPGVDGSFAFPEVSPGSYTATVSGLGASIPLSTEVTVGNADISGVEIRLPGQKEIRGRVVVEGKAPVPRFTARLVSTSPYIGSIVTVLRVDPETTGDFKVIITEGEYQDGEVSLPKGYTLESLTYGSIALFGAPLTVSPADTGEFLVKVSAPDLAPAQVTGRASGLDAAALAPGAAKISMTSTSYAGALNSGMNSNGSFAFPEVFPGRYILSLSGPGVRPNTCVPVVVSGENLSNVEIESRQDAKPDDIRIISAIYGALAGSADVTPLVSKYAAPGLDEFFAAPRWMEVEPARGQPKDLVIGYQYQCREFLFTGQEPAAVSHRILVEHANNLLRRAWPGASAIDAPNPANASAGAAEPNAEKNEIVVLNSYYGLGQTFTSVTPRVRELLRPGAAPFVVDNAALNLPPASGWSSFIVTYVYKGNRHTWIAASGQTVNPAELALAAETGAVQRQQSAEPPGWLADAQPDAPREPGDPGPGFGPSPWKEAAIASLLKGLAELRAIAPEDRTADIDRVIALAGKALADAQGSINYVYPPAAAKPIEPSLKRAPASMRLANAAKALAQAAGQLNSSSAGGFAELRTRAIEETQQALQTLENIQKIAK